MKETGSEGRSHSTQVHHMAERERESDLTGYHHMQDDIHSICAQKIQAVPAYREGTKLKHTYAVVD